jgi:hypothetical protein
MKKNYIRITLGFGIFLVFLGILDFCLPAKSFLKDYVRGTFTETLGIIATLIFVQYIFSETEEKDDRKVEIEAIKRANKVLSLYISEYKMYAYRVVTPLKNRSNNICEEIPKDFRFNDMHDLFFPSLITIDGHEPVVLLCLEAQNKIKKAIENIIININFKYFPELSSLLIEYLEVAGKYNLYDGIKEYCVANKEIRETIISIIKEHSGPLEYLPSNLKNNFIALHNLIIYHREYFERYNEIIKDINENI